MKVIKGFNYIRKHGVLAFIKTCYYRQAPINYFYDKYYNVNTTGYVFSKDLGLVGFENCDYRPIPFRHLLKVLNTIPLEKNQCTFLDYGCGKGRALICASTYPFKKIIGVELSRDLLNLAQKNIDNMRHAQTKNTELIQCDAQLFAISDDINVIYFFNPFVGTILENVVKNIHSSFQKTPRKIFIIFFNNSEFDRIVKNQDWLKKIVQKNFCKSIYYGLYETII
ncbi:MAG: class I SAM-dependent methyltransferase [Legionella sp.]